MIKLLSHTRQITNYRPSRATGTIRPNDTVSMVTGGVGGSEFTAAKWFNRHTTHGTNWKAKNFGHLWEKASSLYESGVNADTNPAAVSLALESALSLIYGIKGNNQQSELKKLRAHGVRQRAVLLYWRRDLMKRPIPCLGFLETWHYKRVTERPLNPCQVCVCLCVCYLLPMVEDG